MLFQPDYSKFLRNELGRLDSGNTTEKKRAQTLRSKVATVCQEPFNHPKDLPENYNAVNVTGRFRLFFKVHPEHAVVFFTWMNDEQNIHTSGAVDDSYQEFRRKLGNGEIETYVHIEWVDNEFIFNGAWGNGYIYIEFSRTLSNESEEWSRSSLTLTQVGQREYVISSIEVSDENIGLASQLIERTILKADEGAIVITYELFLISANLDKSRHVLTKYNFIRTADDAEIELWVRPPR